MEWPGFSRTRPGRQRGRSLEQHASTHVHQGAAAGSRRRDVGPEHHAAPIAWTFKQHGRVPALSSRAKCGFIQSQASAVNRSSTRMRTHAEPGSAGSSAPPNGCRQLASCPWPGRPAGTRSASRRTRRCAARQRSRSSGRRVRQHDGVGHRPGLPDQQQPDGEGKARRTTDHQESEKGCEEPGGDVDARARPALGQLDAAAAPPLAFICCPQQISEWVPPSGQGHACS
jgi:hypothetical protein